MAGGGTCVVPTSRRLTSSSPPLFRLPLPSTSSLADTATDDVDALDSTRWRRRRWRHGSYHGALRLSMSNSTFARMGSALALVKVNAAAGRSPTLPPIPRPFMLAAPILGEGEDSDCESYDDSHSLGRRLSFLKLSAGLAGLG